MIVAIASACRLSDGTVRKNKPLSGNSSSPSAVALGEQAAIPACTMTGNSAKATFEDAGPTMTSTCASMSCCRATDAVATSAPSSRTTSLTGTPSTPPERSLASDTATRNGVPREQTDRGTFPARGSRTPIWSTPSSAWANSVVAGGCSVSGARAEFDGLQATAAAPAMSTAIHDALRRPPTSVLGSVRGAR